MTDAELDAIRARADAATPGPWQKIQPGGPNGPFWGICNPKGNIIALRLSQSTQDADFISAAREDVPALVAEIDRLRAENDQVRAMLRQLEWIPRRESWFLTYDRLRYCHICGGFVAQGHAPDCKLAALLRVEEACFAVIDTRAAS